MMLTNLTPCLKHVWPTLRCAPLLQSYNTCTYAEVIPQGAYNATMLRLQFVFGRPHGSPTQVRGCFLPKTLQDRVLLSLGRFWRK